MTYIVREEITNARAWVYMFVFAVLALIVWSTVTDRFGSWLLWLYGGEASFH